MKWLPKSLGAVALLALVGASTTACEENESMLFIVGVMRVTSGDCVVEADADAPIQSNGVLDVSLRSGYTAAVLVGSQLTQRGSRDQLRTETARLSLQGAEVTLTDYEGRVLNLGGGVPNPYSTVGTGFVNPGSGEDAGYGVIFVDIVPAGINIPDQTIISKVRVFGTTLGGAELESNEYIFPIRICRGCLITYPTSAFDDTQGTGEFLCATASDAPVGGSGTVCLPGQDDFVPCTMCSTFNDVCRNPCNNCTARQTLSECAGTPAPPDCG